MLAAPSIIHTLQCTHGFQTHYQSRDYFLKPDAPATATEHHNTGLVHADTNTSAPRPALLQAHQLVCDESAIVRRSNLSIPPWCSELSSCFSTVTISCEFAAPLPFLHLLLLQLFMDAAQRRTCMRNKNYLLPSPQPDLTTNTVFTLLNNLLSTFPGFPCVLIICLL